MNDLKTINREVEKAILSPKSPIKNAPQDNILIASLMAGLGGTLPTLCKIAASITNEFDVTYVLRLGVIVALSLYFVIGFISCLGFRESRPREGFILGISAPALIFSFLSGVSGKNETAWELSLFSKAYAQSSIEMESINESTFWQDFKWAIGAQEISPAEIVRHEEVKNKLATMERNYKMQLDRNTQLVSALDTIEIRLDSAKYAIGNPVKVAELNEQQHCTNQITEDSDSLSMELSCRETIEKLSKEAENLRLKNNTLLEDVKKSITYTSRAGDIGYSALAEVKKLLSDQEYFNKKRKVLEMNDSNRTESFLEDEFTYRISLAMKAIPTFAYIAKGMLEEPFLFNHNCTKIYMHFTMLDPGFSVGNLCGAIYEIYVLRSLTFEPDDLNKQ